MSRSIAELKREIQAQDMEIFDLISKVQYLLEEYCYDDKGVYQFPDGEVWKRFNPDLEVRLNRLKESKSE